MLKNTIFAAAAIAISMAAFQPAAQAGQVQIDVSIGGHGGHGGHGHGGWGHGPGGWGHGGHGHWGGGHFPYKLTCRQGKRKLRRNGYRNINPYDCNGRRYGYRVVRNHKIFKIRMNAFTGRYHRQFIGYVY